MKEDIYHTKIERLFLDLEEALESASPEVETFQQEGILTVILPKGSQLIFSRQAALQELWLASPIGAFHFHAKEHNWVTHQGQTLEAILQTIFDYFQVSVNLPLFSDKL